MVEALDDVVLHRAPVSAGAVEELIARTVVGRHLRSLGANLRPLGTVVEKFSLLVAALQDHLSSVDVNPLIVCSGGEPVTIVDALAVSNKI